jgi:hypothetical protein
MISEDRGIDAARSGIARTLGSNSSSSEREVVQPPGA